jgi:hypothetical protein
MAAPEAFDLAGELREAGELRVLFKKQLGRLA